MNSNRNGNNASAKNDNAVNQEVTVNVGGAGTEAGSGDCYTRGLCFRCSRSPFLCPIADKHLGKEPDTYIPSYHGG